MSTFTFITVECIRQQDVPAKDEPHLFLDGVDSWNGVPDKGDIEPVGLSKYFDGSMSVTLKEKYRATGRPLERSPSTRARCSRRSSRPRAPTQSIWTG